MSQMLTLYITPVIYGYLDRAGKRRQPHHREREAELRRLFLFTAGLCLTGSPAFADPGPFLGFDAGWSIPADISLHSRDNATPLQGKITTHGAAEVAGELGYAMANGISASLEVAHIEY